jgi:hypothetical protein
MKKIFTLIALCYAGLSNAQVPTNGLVAEWKFTDGTVTDSINMVSGTAQLGAISTTDRFGFTGNAYDLPPAGYLTFGDLNDDITTGLNATFSYSFWVKFDEVNSTARYIIGKTAFESLCSLAGRQFVISANTSNKVEIQLFGALTGGHKKFQSSGTVSAGSWTHIVVSVAMNSLVANSNSVPTMYINGVAQTVTSNETVGGGLSANGMDNGSAFFSAGRYNNNQGNPCATTQYLDGQFDDLRVYNRMLGAEEVTALYNEAAPVGCADPIINADLASITYLCPGTTGTEVSVDATGDNLTYQWQSSPNGVDWTDISDEVESSYNVSQAGMVFQVVINAGCGSSVNSASTQSVNANSNSVNTLLSNGNGTICEGESVTIYTQVGQTSTFVWTPGGETGFSIVAAPTETTDYVVTATGSNTGCVATAMQTITVLPNVDPVIVENNGTLEVTGGPYDSYQWYNYGNLIPGAEDATYVPMETGNYVVAVNGGACGGTSAFYPVIITSLEFPETQGCSISPNPFTDAFIIEVKETTVVSLFNVLGEEVLSSSVIGRTTIEAESLPSGIYFLRSSEDAAVIRVVKH